MASKPKLDPRIADAQRSIATLRRLVQRVTDAMSAEPSSEVRALLADSAVHHDGLYLVNRDLRTTMRALHPEQGQADG